MFEAELGVSLHVNDAWVVEFERRTGIEIDRGRYDLTTEKLACLSDAYGCNSVSGLIDKGFSINSPPGLRDRIIHECTVHETRFFRSPQGLEKIVGDVKHISTPPQILSVGCSSGEEVYSLAHMLNQSGVTEARIKGIDVSRSCIESAKKGIYPGAALEGVGVQLSDRKWEVSEKLKAMCAFQECNLSKAPYLDEQVDMIICFNMLIYYRITTRHKMLALLSSALRENGSIYLRKGEDCNWTPKFLIKETTDELTVFRKSRP